MLLMLLIQIVVYGFLGLVLIGVIADIAETTREIDEEELRDKRRLGKILKRYEKALHRLGDGDPDKTLEFVKKFETKLGLGRRLFKSLFDLEYRYRNYQRRGEWKLKTVLPNQLAGGGKGRSGNKLSLKYENLEVLLLPQICNRGFDRENDYRELKIKYNGSVVYKAWVTKPAAGYMSPSGPCCWREVSGTGYHLEIFKSGLWVPTAINLLVTLSEEVAALEEEEKVRQKNKKREKVKSNYFSPTR